MSEPLPIGRKRLSSKAHVKRLTTHILIDEWLFINELADQRGQEITYTLNQVLQEYREKFHAEL